MRTGPALRSVGGRDGEDNVTASDREIGVRLALASLQRRDGDLGQRDEVPLRRVQNVLDAATVAVERERERTLDAVALGLDSDAFALVVHALATRLRARVAHCRHYLRTVYVRATVVRRPVGPAATTTT